VRVSLLIDAIARKENIEASFSEIDAEMKTMAKDQGMEYDKVREMYSSRRGWTRCATGSWSGK